MTNHFGKVSRLELKTDFQDGKTVITDESFTAPYKIAHPFYDPSGHMTVMLLSASAGIMAGDVQEFRFHVGEGSHLSFTSQSFEKIHRMEDGEAKRQTEIEVGPGAFFSYEPLPTIPFADSAFTSTTKVNLKDKTSGFIYQEILTCGRKAMGEKFAYRFYHNLVEIRQQGKLIYRDNARFAPSEMPMEQIGMMEEYSHLLNIVLCNRTISDNKLIEIRSRIESEPDTAGGITRLTGGSTAIRVLGQTAQQLQKLSNQFCLS